jgi:hypothetical protein
MIAQVAFKIHTAGEPAQIHSPGTADDTRLIRSNKKALAQALF